MINSHFISIQGAKIHYLEGGDAKGLPILFLHGASFNARTWQEIGLIEKVSQAGYRVICVDLPGYGNSQNLSGFQETFLISFIKALELNHPVVISPSMSGNYSLPLVVNNQEKLSGFVAIAPMGIARFKEQLTGVKLPTLAIWGSNDRIVPVSQAEDLVKGMSNARKVILENAGHACYMRATEAFENHILDFINSVKIK